MASSLSENKSSDFAVQLDIAQLGKGSRYFEPGEALRFAEYALEKGLGISKLEAHGVGPSRGRHQLWHQMLGIDDHGKNWGDHRNPVQALSVFIEKHRQALEEGIELRYKFWLNS